MSVRLAVVLFIVGLTAAPAVAQAPPVLVIEAAPELAPARARLDSYDRRPLADIVGLVGLETPGPPIRVELAAEGTASAAQVEPWTAGFAVTDAGLIVLFPSRSPVYPHDTLEDVLRHEVAHILIGRAAGGRPVPRWFHEGLAVAVERPWGLEDRSRLAWALLVGPRLTLRDIDVLFLGGQSAQSRGYSLAAAVVRDLMQEYGITAPARILDQVAAGRAFDEALTTVAARAIRVVEDEFWNRQRVWTVWIPLLTSSAVIWLVVIGLAVLAVRGRRRRAAQIRKRWAEEEARDRTANSAEE